METRETAGRVFIDSFVAVEQEAKRTAARGIGEIGVTFHHSILCCAQRSHLGRGGAAKRGDLGKAFLMAFNKASDDDCL